MDKIHERIKELREKKNLSQEEFAKKINITRSAISSIERNKNKLTERTFSDICDVFNVNEDWLRHGKEPIFKQEKPFIDTIAEVFDLSDTGKAIVDTYLNSSREQQQLLEDFILKTVQNSPSAKARLAEIQEEQKELEKAVEEKGFEEAIKEEHKKKKDKKP